MASAELIAIGTELLLGEIQDTNTRYLTRQLRQLGIDIFRTTMIGDNPLRIAEVMQECLTRSDIVITTGGLGPTVDDPTRDAAALAYKVDVEFHPELWTQISNRFLRRGLEPSENNKKQAFLPSGAVALPNPVGTAPAFYLSQRSKLLICLPGVPGEMETIFHDSVIPLLQRHYGTNEIIKTRVLHTCGMGESLVDTKIADLEKMQNPTVGLCAHPGIVDIRITAKAKSDTDASAMLSEIENEIFHRLPEVIYGVDDFSLHNAIDDLACSTGVKILISFTGFSAFHGTKFGFGDSDNISIFERDLSKELAEIRIFEERSVVFGVNLLHTEDVFTLKLFLSFENDSLQEQRFYNGPSSMAETWAVNTSLGYLWKKLKALHPGENNEKS
jgi:competence/damage-inducible protein CinA-like protein